MGQERPDMGQERAGIDWERTEIIYVSGEG